ncbi:MAG TPA: Ig-like domain-containing protein [Candidatus Methylomirabilis sp.]|nr:Ig-like domain-containing protein [Candidatus Methylomirabilis sp.]
MKQLSPSVKGAVVSSLLIIVLGAASLVTAQGGVPAPPTTPAPTITVRFGEPQQGIRVSGVVTIKAVAITTRGPSPRVQFFIDGQIFGKEIIGWTDRQFSISWDTRKYNNGTHRIGIMAENPDHPDQPGSAEITVTVQNGATAPSSGGSTSKKKPTSNVGTLNVSAEGDLYLAGVGYLGRNGRVIRVYAGTYTLYAVSPSKGTICWQRRVRIDGGKTTLVRISGKYCR